MRTAARTAHDLGNAMLAQLYDAVCGESATAKDAYLTWRAPDRTFDASDFDFCTQGFGVGLDDHARRRLTDQARTVAELVDGPPDARLSTVYADILRRCAVVRADLSDEEQLKVEKYRNLLRSTRKLIDPITGDEREVTDEGPMLKAYRDRQAAYLAAELCRNLARVTGDAGPDGDGHRSLVCDAMDAWVGSGYRDEVDQVVAYLDQVGRRDLVLWRRHLVGMFDDALVDDPGGRFHHTTLVPADFATGPSWFDYTFDPDVLDPRPRVRSTSWRAGVADFAFGATAEVGLPGFRVGCRLAQVVISRPWFFPEFLHNRGWVLPDGDLVSDGGDPPSGRLVGYPTAVLFVRDLRISSAEFAASHRATGGPATWGPFRLAGATVDDTGLTVPGMQAIGFVNRQLGRVPDPLPELDQGRFG